MYLSSTKNELFADYNKDGYATDKGQIIISKSMRKITNMIGRQKISLVFTNQLRQKMGVMFGDPWTTSGGRNLAFHSSVRIRLKNMGQIKTKVNGKDRVVGIKGKSTNRKKQSNGPPLSNLILRYTLKEVLIITVRGLE